MSRTRDPSPEPFVSYRVQIPLREYPTEIMSVSCTQCDRKGRLSKAKFVQEWGAGIGLVDLLQVIAKDCPKLPRDFQGISRCGVRYNDL